MIIGRSIVVGFAMSSLLVGCADSSGFAQIGTPFDIQWVTSIQVTWTTQREVAEWFGEPVAYATLSDEEGVINGNSRYSYLHAVSGASGQSAVFLEIDFDPVGRVTDFSLSQAESDPSD